MIPGVKRFINIHNPNGKYLIEKTGILDIDRPLIIDVGANKGQTIDLFLSINKKSEIFSFEPTPELVEYLIKKYEGYNNIHIVDIALSDENGEANFYTSTFSATNSLLVPNVGTYNRINSDLGDILSKTDARKCKVRTLDDWFINNITNNRIIDILKIDTQGTEYNILSGSKSILHTNVKTVILEFQYIPFYFNSQPFYKTMELLYENGYYLFSFFESNKSSNMRLLENNAILFNKYYFKEDF